MYFGMTAQVAYNGEAPTATFYQAFVGFLYNIYIYLVFFELQVKDVVITLPRLYDYSYE
jgi:hypothetical protein